MTQVRAFAGTCLPQTMELASVLRAILIPHLRNLPQKWPFHDRVLAWLVPNFESDIRRFHGSSGKPLSDLKSAKALRLLDADFLTLLAQKVEAVRPGVMRLLQELVSLPREDET